MTVPEFEADSITVTVTTLNDQNISTTAMTSSSLEDGLLPSSLVIHTESKTSGSLESNTLTEHTQDDTTDGENYPQDGRLARANTVASNGKPEAVQCLDVAAIMSRLQSDLKKDEMWEREETDEEVFGEREGVEDGEKTGNRWTKTEGVVKEVQKTAPTQMSPVTLVSEQPKTVVKPGIQPFFDANTRTIVSDKGKGISVEPSPISEESCKTATIPKFERGTGPAPGEEKTSRRMRSKRSNGFRLFGFGPSSRADGDRDDENSSGLAKRKSRAQGVTEEKKKEKKEKAFRTEYATKKAALSKAKLQLSEATTSVRALENSIRSIEKQMLSKGVEISGGDEKKRAKASS